MIWVVKEFTTYQILEMGEERVRFPIRVEIEFKQEGTHPLRESLRKKVLYNKPFLLRRYPQLREEELDLLVEERVRRAIEDHFSFSEEEASSFPMASFDLSSLKK